MNDLTTREPGHAPDAAAAGTEGLPLHNVVVLDTTTVIGGPLMSALLADFGARVIKIETPGKGDDGRKLGKSGKSMYWRFMARNKECITCNLRTEEGQRLFKELAAKADVVLTSVRPGVMEEWGLGYDTLSAINPRIVMLQLSGYGQDGPYAQRPGYGALAEAMSGLVYMTGDPSGPPALPGAPIADPMASAMGALAILLALRQRDGSGKGQRIDLSLYGPMLYIMGSYLTEYSATGVYPVRGEQLGRRILRDVACAKDGAWVVFSVISDTLIARVDRLLRERGCTLPGNGEYLPETPTENYVALGACLKEWIGTLDRKSALEELERAGIPCAPIYSVADVFTDPHFTTRADFVPVDDPEIGTMRMPRSPFRMSEAPVSVRHPGKSLGADNDRIYSEFLGLDQADLARLRSGGVI